MFLSVIGKRDLKLHPRLDRRHEHLKGETAQRAKIHIILRIKSAGGKEDPKVETEELRTSTAGTEVILSPTETPITLITQEETIHFHTKVTPSHTKEVITTMIKMVITLDMTVDTGFLVAAHALDPGVEVGN